MSDYQLQYQNYIQRFNAALDKLCATTLACKPQKLSESLKYTLCLGGKRIRPVLTLAVSDVLGLDKQNVINFALALEMIHTYSLIHDDLPEMDNDDYRRGKLSNHKVFGVGNAVLAGDGLLNTAYSILLDECFKGNDRISAAKYICDCAGINGMIAGQSADLSHENFEEDDEEALKFIYENKTSKLIMAAVAVPSVLSGGKYYPELVNFGRELGVLFQFTDDILDVEGQFDSLGKSIGKDAEEHKYTAVKLYGLDKCKIAADIYTDRCCKYLEGIEGDTAFLKEFVNSVRTRIY